MTKIKEVYLKSGSILDVAHSELALSEKSELQSEFLSLKFMAATIHNEICREFYFLNSNPTTGISKLISIGPIILKLFEANLWYQKVGNKKLRELAHSRGLDKLYNAKSNALKELKPNRIDKYSDFRSRGLDQGVRVIDLRNFFWLRRLQWLLNNSVDM
jgi:hypothetical protein